MAEGQLSITRLAEITLLSVHSFSDGINALEGNLLGESIRLYFETLLTRHSITSAEAVRAANLDKDFGRQILIGDRMARRDYYLQLAFGMGLSYEETQSLLSFLGRGQIYAVRQRDAALMYALQRGMNLLEVQLLLDEHGLTPLGDDDDDEPDHGAQSTPLLTKDVEQRIRESHSFQDVSDEIGDRFQTIAINDYFNKLLSARNIARVRVLVGAGINVNIGYQLFSGKRIAKNRDAYIRIALVLGLSLPETQQMLKILEKGALYPLKRRDAALVFGIGHGFSIDDMQKLLADHGLPELSS